MKSVLTATAVILAFASQAFAFNLSCDDGRISIQKVGGVNYLNGSPMKTYGNFLIGAPGKFKVWAGLDPHVEATLWIFADQESEFVSRIVDCEG